MAVGPAKAMDLAAYDAFCAALPATTTVVQWGGAHVWKVGGKVFAVGAADGPFRVSYKVTQIAFEMLRDEPGSRPAPYLASRGMLWIQSDGEGGMDRTTLEGYLHQSHALVAAGLSKKARAALGLV